MKKLLTVLASMFVCWVMTPAVDAQTDSPPPAEPTEAADAAPDSVPDGEAEPAEVADADDAVGQGGEAPAVEPVGSAPSASPAVTPATPVPTTRAVTPAPATDSVNETPAADPAPQATPPVRLVADGEKGLRLNFRGAPLEMVLNYLSEAAGFIIILETEIRGRLDVWSNQPLDKEEAVDLLNKVLNKNGYAAIRDGRTLTIVSREDAKKRDIPVRSGGDPAQIQKGEAIITQIIPVRFINAVQVSRDLQPLFPASATIAANEGGNAVVITDTQTNIRRVAEIIRALDTSISSVSTVRVFALHFADAKALATVVRDLFAGTESGRSGQQQQQIRGFRMPGGFGGDQGGGQQNAGNARVATPKVVAVADERSNSLVVSAPEDQMLLIADMVLQIDTNVDDVTELRVFRLEFADPQETADLIAGLFPDPTTQSGQSGRGQFRFGGFGGGGRTTGATETSSRLQKETKVIAVPDLRTQSIVVSAAHELMDQIATMVKQLDADPAKKQKVFVYSVENTDPQAVEDILRGLFEGQNTRNRSMNNTRNNQSQAGNQLNNRANNASRNQGNRTSGIGGGTSGFGGGR